MRVNLTIILLACIASLSGQNVKVTKHYEITPSVGQSAFYPILSPDGIESYILLKIFPA